MKSKTSKSAKILKMLADGVSVKEAARRAGTSPNYVYFVKWREANPTDKKPVKKGNGKKTVPVQDTAVKGDTGWYTLPPEPAVEKGTDPLDVQIGGTHYKDMAIQPIEFITANNLGFLEGCIVKRVSRWKAKDGIVDLEKAKHELDLLIKLEESRTELRFL